MNYLRLGLDKADGRWQMTEGKGKSTLTNLNNTAGYTHKLWQISLYLGEAGSSGASMINQPFFSCF
ncbi:MAG: hypothetical protein RID53_08135 [Coleofasciculus sp. B1-GNL1-01]|uniref:hypothetical protein n=1 Tax=Coleofasciculus sp. B1-GNL1-01 TaxID=3068484 RepID=UPI0033051284